MRTSREHPRALMVDANESQLFHVSLPPKLALDNVYVNGLHALRRFEIRNVCDEHVKVKLRSNLGVQIAYQLSNENMPDGAMSGSQSASESNSRGSGNDQKKRLDTEKSLRSLRSSRDSLLSSSVVSSSVSLDPLSDITSQSELDISTASPRPLVCLSQITTNTAAAASLGAFASADSSRLNTGVATSTTTTTTNATTTSANTTNATTANANGQEFNQLFNFVNYIDEVSIAPGAAQTIILAFLPDNTESRKLNSIMSATESKDNNTCVSLGSDEEEAHEFINIQGLLLFYGYRVSKIRQTQSDISSISESTRPISLQNFNYFQLQQQPPNWELTRDSVMDGKILPQPESAGGWISVDRKATERTTTPIDLSTTSVLRNNMIDSILTNRISENVDITINSTKEQQQQPLQDYKSSTRLLSPNLRDLSNLGITNNSNSVDDHQKVDTNAYTSLSQTNNMIQSESFHSSPNPSSRPEHQVTIKFKSRVCRTMLWTDVVQNGMAFEDCVVGGMYFKDFTVWNRSEIDLYWVLNAVDLSTNSEHEDSLRFTDYETGELLTDSASKPIPGFSYCRVRVTFKPRDVGEFNYDVQLENANDAANVETARLHAVVRSVLKEESLIVTNTSGSNVLDFGECCAGIWNQQKLTLKNVSEVPIEIRISAENALVTFDTKGNDFFDQEETTVVTPDVMDLDVNGWPSSKYGHGREPSNLLAMDLTSDPQKIGIENSTPITQILLKSASLALTNSKSPDMENLSTNARTIPRRPCHIPSGWSTPSSSSSSRSSSPHLQSRLTHSEMLLRHASCNGFASAEIENGDNIKNRQLIDTHTEMSNYPPTDLEMTPNDLNRTQRLTSRSSSLLRLERDNFAEDYDSDSDADASWINLPQLMEGMQSLHAHTGRDGLSSSPMGTRDTSTLSPNRSMAEELVLRPGVEKTIVVRYRPDKDQSTADYRAGIFTRRTFRINIVYALLGSPEKEKKTIQCRARSCTSFIEASPKVINFGDTDIGTLKSASVLIANRSELPARVQLSYTSKVLNCVRDEVLVPPKQSVEVKVDIYPRKINPDYRKQITIANLLNRDNDQIVEVRSTNIDKHRITFHSLFYRIWTPRSTNFIDFGVVMINSYAVRTFTIQNISRKPVLLELSSSLPDEIQILRRRECLTRGSNASAPTFKSRPSTAVDANDELQRSSSSPSDNDVLRPAKSKDILLERISERLFAKKQQPKGILSLSSSALNTRTGATSDMSESEEPLSAASGRSVRYKRGGNSGNFIILGNGGNTGDDALVGLGNNASGGTNGNNEEPPSSTVNSSDYLDLAVLKEGQRSPKRPPRTPSISTIKPSKLSDLHRTSSQRRTGAPASALMITLPKSETFRDSNLPSSNNSQDSIPDTNTSETNLEREAEGDEQGRIVNLIGSSRESFDALISVLESVDHVALPVFASSQVEEKYVKLNMSIRRELDGAIRCNEIVPVSEPITIPPGCDQSIVLILSPSSRLRPSVLGKPRKLDAKIRLRILAFDRDVEEASFENLLAADLSQIPVREFLLRSSICRSIMELGQRHINLGTLSRHETKSKTLVIRNRSEVPLLYSIKKTGSIASGDLVLDDSCMGVIRSLGVREVTFALKPSMPGPFQEKLIVENIQDVDNQQVVSLKAFIKKPDSFQVDLSSLDFGACLINEGATYPQQIVVQNTDKQVRVYEVKYEIPESDMSNDIPGAAVSLVFDYEDVDIAQNVNLDAEMEEQIESLEQKLKIATRKGREEKIAKITDRIAMLKRGEKVEPAQMIDRIANVSNRSSPHSVSSEVAILNSNPIDNGYHNGKPMSPTNEVTVNSAGSVDPNVAKQPIITLPKTKRSERSIMFAVYPNASKRIIIQLRALTVDSSAIHSFEQASESISGSFSVYEQRNTDAVKQVMFSVIVCYDNASYTQRMQELQQVMPFMTNFDTKYEAPESNGDKQISLSTNPTIHRGFPLMYEGSGVIVDGGGQIDLGRITIGTQATFSFVLRNDSNRIRSYRLGFDTKDSQGVLARHERLQIIPRQGFLRAGGRQQIDVTLITLTHGSHTLQLSPISYVATVPLLVSYTASYREYISFSTNHVVSEFLDMGVCYTDPDKRFAKILKLPIRNITDIDITVSATTNMSQQVFIYEDETCELPVTLSQIGKGATRDVYVALQPNVSSQPLLVGKRTFATFEARDLIGGFKFTMYEQRSESNGGSGGVKNDRGVETESGSSKQPLAVQTLKFQALIGQSVFSVSSRFFNFGSTQTFNKSFTGAFTIFNLSTRLPLHYRLHTSSSSITLGKSEGELDGTDVAATAVKIRKCREDIHFEIRAVQVGYLYEYITVVNLHHPSWTIRVFVSLLVEDGKICLQTIDQSVSEVDSENAGNKLPMLKWPEILVEDVDGTGIAKAQTPDATYQQHVTVINNDSQAITLVPESDIHIHVEPQMPTPCGSTAITNLATDVHKVWKSCGDSFSIAAGGGSAVVRVDAPACPAFTDDDILHLCGLKSVKMRGILRLRDLKTGVVLKVLELLCFFCISEAELVLPSINCGMVGYVSTWAELPIEIAIRNLSSAHMEMKVDECPGVRMTERTIRLIPSAVGVFNCALVPQQLSAKSGPLALQVTLRNTANGKNVLRQTIEMLLTECQLRFDRLDNGALVLPSVQHPIVEQSAPSTLVIVGTGIDNATGLAADTWFIITNVSVLDAHFEVSVRLNPEARKILVVHALSRFSNSPLRGVVTLSAKGFIEVRLRASAKENSRLDIDALSLLQTYPVALGNLCVIINTAGRTESTTIESIPIHGGVIEVAAFGIAEKQISFNSHLLFEQETALPLQTNEEVITPGLLHIHNLLGFAPLRFQLRFEGSQELDLPHCFRIYDVDDQLQGIVPPAEKKEVKIELLDAIIGFSSDLRLVVEDLDSLKRHSYSVPLLLTDITDQPQRARDPKADLSVDEVPDPMEEGLSPSLGNNTTARLPSVTSVSAPSSTTHLPRIHIKGCKVIGQQLDEKLRFELDLGQQDVGGQLISKKIWLESKSAEKISYRIRTVAPEYDRTWLTLSRTEGVLDESESNQSQAVIITCTPASRNVFSTYIFIENIDNPADCKSIRVYMEVVARQILRKNLNALHENALVFDVFVNGVDLYQPVVRFQNIFYYNEYYSRSISIINHESVSLEFTLKSTLPPTDSTEILFSISRNVTKLFKSIVVDPDSQVRVYLRIRPVPSATISLAQQDQQNLNDFVEEKNFSITVNCRLVKNFQKNISVTASCRWPQIRVSRCDLTFSGEFEQQQNDSASLLHIEPEASNLIIENLFPSILRIRLMNETLFFQTEPASIGDIVLQAKEKIVVRVIPNVARLIQHASLLKRDKYFLEHIVVYSANRPSENIWLNIRISFGYLKDYQFLMSRNSSAFESLELRISLLLRNMGQYALSLAATSNVIGAVHDGDVTEIAERLREIRFEFIYTLDQLIFYATSSSSGESFYQLASLLFSALLSSNMIISCPTLGFSKEQTPWNLHTNAWVSSLFYFLSFFPLKHPMLDALRQLYMAALKRTEAQFV